MNDPRIAACNQSQPATHPAHSAYTYSVAIHGTFPRTLKATRKAVSAPSSHHSVELFTGSSIRIGRFRCPAEDRRWRGENRIEGGPVIVFPRTAVEISVAGSGRVIADAARVMFYNDGQHYQRRVVDPRGDQCEWFAIDQASLCDLLRLAGAHDSHDFSRVFAHACGPSAPSVYLAQRNLFRAIEAGRTADALRIEEAGLGLAGAAIRFAIKSGGARAKRSEATRRFHRETAEAAREFMVRNFQSRLRVSDIAAAVGVSAFHLCRVFREHAGLSLHACLTRLRLAAALAALENPRQEIIPLAMSLGFSSHAHFTGVFTRTFGMPPSQARQTAQLRELLPALSKIQQAA